MVLIKFEFEADLKEELVNKYSDPRKKGRKVEDYQYSWEISEPLSWLIM